VEAQNQELHIQAGTLQIQAQNVALREDALLEEVRIEGGAIRFDLDAAGVWRLETGELRVRAALSEANLNRLLTANLPADMPLKNLHIDLFSSKARLTGTYVKLIGIPISADVAIKIRNGVDVYFDLTGARAGVGLPAAAVEVIAGQVNRELSGKIGAQLRQLPFPVFLDEIRCEPGRLTLLGRTRLALSGSSVAP
jgi:hypothetical protein